jgi:hypothetical protein
VRRTWIGAAIPFDKVFMSLADSDHTMTSDSHCTRETHASACTVPACFLWPSKAKQTPKLVSYWTHLKLVVASTQNLGTPLSHPCPLLPSSPEPSRVRILQFCQKGFQHSGFLLCVC